MGAYYWYVAKAAWPNVVGWFWYNVGLNFIWGPLSGHRVGGGYLSNHTPLKAQLFTVELVLLSSSNDSIRPNGGESTRLEGRMGQLCQLFQSLGEE